jgi:hypothetical protein
MGSTKRKLSIVPSLVLGASFAAVVPACGGTTDMKDAETKDVRPDTFYGVGAVAYCCFEAGVADAGFTGDSSEAGDVRDGG